jgi:hypothetical protein
MISGPALPTLTGERRAPRGTQGAGWKATSPMAYLGLRPFGIVVLAVGLVCRHLPYLHPELANAYQVAASGPAGAP